MTLFSNQDSPGQLSSSVKYALYSERGSRTCMICLSVLKVHFSALRRYSRESRQQEMINDLYVAKARNWYLEAEQNQRIRIILTGNRQGRPHIYSFQPFHPLIPLQRSYHIIICTFIVYKNTPLTRYVRELNRLSSNKPSSLFSFPFSPSIMTCQLFHLKWGSSY